MGNTWAAVRRDKEPHTWTRHRQGASVKTIIPCMSGCHMSPRVDFNRRGARWSCVTARRNLFSLRVNPPLHSLFFACEAAWMPVQGVGLKTDWEGSQEETAVPRVYTSTPAWTHVPLSHPLPVPSQAFHIGQTSLRFHAFECDSSSPPVCDGPNSSGLPTHGVVSPSSLLILGSRCTHAEGLPMSDVERHTAESPQL